MQEKNPKSLYKKVIIECKWKEKKKNTKWMVDNWNKSSEVIRNRKNKNKSAENDGERERARNTGKPDFKL